MGSNPPPKAPWRTLELEITPAGFAVRFDGKELANLTRAEFFNYLSLPQVRPTDEKLRVEADYLPTQPLGLIVDQAKVRVKNMVVEPLAP